MRVPSNSNRLFFLIALSILLCSTADLLASSPQLSIIMPRGIQRGVEHELTFVGNRLQDTEEVLFLSLIHI